MEHSLPVATTCAGKGVGEEGRGMCVEWILIFT